MKVNKINVVIIILILLAYYFTATWFKLSINLKLIIIGFNVSLIAWVLLVGKKTNYSWILFSLIVGFIIQFYSIYVFTKQ